MFGADEACQLWPLQVSCTVGEEDGGKAKRVDYGDESVALFEPVLPGAAETGGVVQHAVGKGLSFPTMSRSSSTDSCASPGCCRT